MPRKENESTANEATAGTPESPRGVRQAEESKQGGEARESRRAGAREGQDQRKVNPGDSGAEVGTIGDTAGADAINRQVQEAADRETEQGFHGEHPRPDKNRDAYTVRGVTEGIEDPSAPQGDTFTRVAQPVAANPTNAGEQVEVEQKRGER